MGTDKVGFAVGLCGGATGSHVTGSDVSHVTGSGPDRKSRDRKRPLQEVCSAHAQPEVAQYPP